MRAAFAARPLRVRGKAGELFCLYSYFVPSSLLSSFQLVFYSAPLRAHLHSTRPRPRRLLQPARHRYSTVAQEENRLRGRGLLVQSCPICRPAVQGWFESGALYFPFPIPTGTGRTEQPTPSVRFRLVLLCSHSGLFGRSGPGSASVVSSVRVGRSARMAAAKKGQMCGTGMELDMGVWELRGGSLDRTERGEGGDGDGEERSEQEEDYGLRSPERGELMWLRLRPFILKTERDFVDSNK